MAILPTLVRAASNSPLFHFFPRGASFDVLKSHSRHHNDVPEPCLREVCPWCLQCGTAITHTDVFLLQGECFANVRDGLRWRSCINCGRKEGTPAAEPTMVMVLWKGEFLNPLQDIPQVLSNSKTSFGLFPEILTNMKQFKIVCYHMYIMINSYVTLCISQVTKPMCAIPFPR